MNKVINVLLLIKIAQNKNTLWQNLSVYNYIQSKYS